MKKTLLLLLLLSLPVQAETILIKRSGGRKSKAILNKKFVFMQAGQEEAFTRSEEEQTSPSQGTVKHSSSKNINTLSKKLVRTQVSKPKATRTKVTKAASSTQGNPNGSSGSSSNAGLTASKPVQQDIYDEGNWGDYAEYETVEFDESLNVNAVILSGAEGSL